MIRTLAIVTMLALAVSACAGKWRFGKDRLDCLAKQQDCIDYCLGERTDPADRTWCPFMCRLQHGCC